MHIMSTHMVLDLVFRTFGLFFHLAALNQMQTRDWTQTRVSQDSKWQQCHSVYGI